jgi:8-oxo-dGTP pyrophosphatase MutT (NUDIX family)
MLDITAAGHLESGETPADGVRELNEELGLTATIDQLVYLGVKHDVADIGDHTKNREFADVYLLRDDRLLGEYLLQEEEVSGLVEVEVQDGLRLFSCEVDSVPAHATRLVDGAAIDFEFYIRRDDLIPRVDSYYYKVFIMAERYFSGSQYLAI